MAESIAIPSGWSVRLYLDDSESSPSACFSGTDTDLWNNTFSNGTTVANQATWMRVYNNTSCAGLTPPNAPSLNSPANGYVFSESESITLSWSATGAEYSGEIWGGPGGTLTFGLQSSASKNIGSQWAGYIYSWHVKAKNSAGESGWSSTWNFTVRPAKPTNLLASAISCNQVNLSWNDNSANEEGYKVYRNGSLIATLGSGTTNYQDSGLGGNTSYSYVVKAYRSSIESDTSNTANVTTSGCPVVPSTPSNFRVSLTTINGVTLAWDDVSGEAGFNIYRWGYGANEWDFYYLTTVPANVTSYTQIGLDCGSDFNYYQVSAYNGNGESPRTGWVQGTTAAGPFSSVSKWTSSFDLSHGWTVKDYVRTVGDVNKDGNADLIGFGLDGVYVALSNGSGFGAVGKWTSSFDLSHGWTVKDYVRTVGDVNGDGKADLIGFGLDGVYVALSNGSGFGAVSKWTSSFDLSHGWTVSQYVRTVGDVNGDGKADLIGFGLDGVYISLAK